MSRFARTFAREPLYVVGLLWPLALLVPFAPGLPRPTNGGLTWRQEATTALLLSVTFALLLRRRLRSERRRDASVTNLRGTRRLLWFALILPLAGFVAWSAASILWASNLSPAVHYALTWTTYLLFFIALRRAVSSARMLRTSVALLAAVVLILSAVNILGYYGSPNSLIRQNGLGEPIAINIPLFVALALTLRRTRAALLCGAAATLGWLSILEIAERAPLFGVLTGLALLAVFMLARETFRPRSFRRVAALAAAFAACLLLQNVPSPFAKSRHHTVFERVKETSASDLNTRARLLYWGAAIEMWRARPLSGVGAAGFDGAFPEARASFVERLDDSSLAAINERYLSAGAHNEYLQILSETGAVGFALFAAFAFALALFAWHALRRATSPLALGAFASLSVFAISSGASSVSFRWMGSGLMFFFVAALVVKFADSARRADDEAERERVASTPESNVEIPATRARRFASSRLPRSLAPAGYAFALAAALVVLAGMCVQALDVSLVASAQSSADPARAESLYRTALTLNPLDPVTRFNYGLWLYQHKREAESLPHLRFALARGFHTSTCYEYLAGAESNAGELESAERTLAEGARVYPRSIFMRARHAVSLQRLARTREAELEMAAAILLDSRAARGWRMLIEDDIDAAIEASNHDNAFARPGELQPEDAVFAVLQENERRFPDSVSKGWRARMRGTAQMLTP